MTGRLEGEKKEKTAELRYQTAEVFLILYYRVFTAVQMYVFVRCWQWTSGSGWRQLSVVWELSGWAVLMAAWGYWRARGMCVWARNSCSLGVMTTCVPSAWFTDAHDLSLLQDLWQDRQDAVNILNTPCDRCFHFLRKELLWKPM